MNKSVEVGQYSFVKCVPVTIRPLAREHLPHVLALFGSSLGERYVTREQLETYATDTGRKGFVALDSRNNIVGAVTCEMWDSDYRSDEKVGALLPDLGFHKSGFLKSLVVSKDHRGRGIGLKLVSAALEWMRSNGSTTEVAVAWVENGRCNAKGILEALGFRHAATVENFWCQESREKGYLCPACGNPCRCTAAIFRR